MIIGNNTEDGGRSGWEEECELVGSEAGVPLDRFSSPWEFDSEVDGVAWDIMADSIPREDKKGKELLFKDVICRRYLGIEQNGKNTARRKDLEEHLRRGGLI